MVAAANAELYTPFPPALVIEDGVQSSEEGSTSDIHSPVFEAAYPTPDVRYHLGHLHLPDASSSLIPPAHFDARYPRHGIQAPDSHLLETLQPPRETHAQHILPHVQSHFAFGMQHHSSLNLALEPPPPIQPPALSPAGDYTFNLPQGRLAEQQMHSVSYDSAPSSSRASFTMAPPPEHKQPPHETSPTVKGNASGSNAQSSPSRPRREASNIVIACRQCRSRKIRCDSTRPHCNNCVRRGNECEYDAKPKRRGPDKRPGTRQRSCKKRAPEAEPPNGVARKKRKMESDDDDTMIAFDAGDGATNGAKQPLLASASPVPDEASGLRMPQAPPLVLETSVQARGITSEAIYPKGELSPVAQHSPVYIYPSMPDYPTNRPIPQSPAPPMRRQDERREHIPRTLSFDYANETWWDSLLLTYASSPNQSYNAIITDITFLLDSSSYWLFFFNRQLLFDDLAHRERRERIQPALVLSALAMSTLMRSSELELGIQGRHRALALRDSAQAALEAACTAQRVDFTLAEAAIILALFESSCHPEHTQQRAVDALQFVDKIVQALALTVIDLDDPDVCPYERRSIPLVTYPQGYVSPNRCGCVTGFPSPPITSNIASNHHQLSFSFNPPWDPSWSIAETRKEECRRICWSALNLIANYTAKCAAFHEEPIEELSLSEPSTFMVLFPGEAYERQAHRQIPGQSPKDSVWALYCRSMLLWTSCVRRRDTSWSTEERANFAIQAWTETRIVQDALDMHTCNLDTAIMYLSREYLYNTRMEVAYELRRLQDAETIGPPMFNRRQAQEWLYYQDRVAQRVKDAVLQIDSTGGHLLTRRPFQSLWFASQVSICLALWNFDRSLFQALDLAKTFLIPLDTHDALWPCRTQHDRTQVLRQRLTDACVSAGVAAPLSPEFTLPPVLRAI